MAGHLEKGVNCPKNVHLLGFLADQDELADWYRRADLTLILSDRETFSLPCAESLCCGTPVVGFKAGTPEQIALPEYSEFVDYGDLDALEATVKKWLTYGKNPAEIGKAAEKKYAKERMVEAFLEQYRRLLWGDLR